MADPEPTLWSEPPSSAYLGPPEKVCIFARACIGNSAVSNQFVVPLDPPLPGPQWADETGEEIGNVSLEIKKIKINLEQLYHICTTIILIPVILMCVVEFV